MGTDASWPGKQVQSRNGRRILTGLRVPLTGPRSKEWRRRPRGGRINVKVEPSVRIGEGRTGVYVNVNDHYPRDADQPEAAGAVMEMLENHFDASVQRSNRLIDHVMSL